MTHLFLCQIGPVQPFIAAGRRTQDLYVGSRILSQLARAGLSAVSEGKGFELIFPMIYAGKLPKGIPHRFAFLCDEEDSQSVANAIRSAIDAQWNIYVNAVDKKYGSWIASDKTRLETFNRQKEPVWVEFYWVAVDYQPENHKTCFENASIALAQRRLFRQFVHIEEVGRKCTLTGAQSSLIQGDKKQADSALAKLREIAEDKRGIIFRNNEYLGTTALIKRLVQFTTADLGDVDEKRFPKSTTWIASGKEERGDLDKKGKEVEGYLAVLHMDGDGMGRNLSAIGELKLHQQFSQKLAEFADIHVPRIIQEEGGKNATLVYAGGDDVLALLPLRHALKCGKELSDAFYALTGCTASAGIAITPHDFPLDVALEMARQAEEKAKDKYRVSDGDKKGAIFVTEAHGTGMIREAGGNWDIVELMDTLIGYFADDTLSGKLGYDMLTIAHDMGGRVPAEARQADLKRTIIRRLPKGGDKDKKKAFAENLAQRIADLAEQKDENGNLRWQDMAHWTILARFIAKPTKEVVGS